MASEQTKDVLKTALEDLLAKTITELTNRIAAGTAASGDISAAISLLKNNGIDIDMMDALRNGSVRDPILRALPFTDEEAA